MLVSIAILITTIAFLAYSYPEMLRNILPSWLAPGQVNEEASKSEKTETSEIAGGDDDGESTPKAEASKPKVEVPTFSLNSNDDEPDEPEPVAPTFPAPNSAQRASAMAPPPRPEPRSSPGLMLPPQRTTPAPRLSAAASLRAPTTGPLPNRGPPQNSQQRVSGGGLAPNTAVKTPNARGKVILSPGHSPMDWAALIRKGNLSGVNGFQRVTPSQLKTMTGRKGKPAWSIWQGKVYNITPYLPFHPGGEAELMKAAGRDGTKLFMDVHPWVNWDNMLESCLVGVMVPENYESGVGSSLDDQD